MTDIVNTTAETQSTLDDTKTPFTLYVESQSSNRPYSELIKDYANLSTDEQYEWIVKAVELAQDNIETCLNKTEQRIYQGKSKPTPTAYNLYVKEMYDKMKQRTNSSKEIFRKIGQLWKHLDEDKKEKYTETAKLVSRLDNSLIDIFEITETLQINS